MSRTLIFTRTKRGADRVAQYLDRAGINAAAIHGDKSQGQRERALASFKKGEVRALVATDIAARGIDVDSVSHVIQYELPQVPEAYVHRIGRTARAGSSGIAISFCADDERPLLKDIQRVTRQTIPSFDRRNDKALGLMAAATASMPSAEQALPEKKAKQRTRRRGDNRQSFGGGGGGGPPGQRPKQGQHHRHGQGGQGARPGNATSIASTTPVKKWNPLQA
jgi:ATP-dependent RNA helicase RhlE